MLLTDISTPEQITDERVAYFASLAVDLSQKSDHDIQNNSDNLLASPDAQSVLQADSTVKLLGSDLVPRGAVAAIFNPAGVTAPAFALSDIQQSLIPTAFKEKLEEIFGGLKAKVKKIFCFVVGQLKGAEGLDLKTIIKDVLVALVPALAASTGLIPVALPIVVTLAALLIKHGADQVCPA